MSRDSRDDRIGELEARLAALEFERDTYAHQNAELMILQQVFTTMNSLMDVDDILGMLLRGVCEALGFGRAAIAEIQDGTIVRALHVDQTPCGFSVTPAVSDMIAGRADFALGSAGDPDCPLADASGAYCIVPLVSRNVVRGLLYVDNAPPDALSEVHLQMIFDFAAQGALSMENARLHHETQRLLDETLVLASTDGLTGLANRRSLMEQFARELWNAQRYETRLGFVLFDLDDLKKINDAHGHSAGDDALRRFADALRGSVRRGDIVARYAGDEFAVLMIATDLAAARIAMERVFGAVRAQGLTCSAGVAIFPSDTATVETLLEAADAALYRAKRAGKNAFAFAGEQGCPA